MPPTMPPMDWLRAILGFTMRPVVSTISREDCQQKLRLFVPRQLLPCSPMLATTTANSLPRARSISFASWYREARQKKIWPEAG